MRFLYERQTRRFYLFLIIVCIFQICLLGVIGIFQTQEIQRILAERELAAASYLLEADIPPSLIASAWNQWEATTEGEQLLQTIGHTEQSQNFLFLLIEQTSLPLILMLLSAGVTVTILILTGTAVFFQRRERMYEEAGKVISCYSENRFEMHLPAGETGTIYRLFGCIEQLAQSLQAKSEMEQRTKQFLKDMISNISHQLKTPLAALSMYMEIIMEEPENEELARRFSQKSLQSIERMERLIQSLLKMARLDTGNIVFDKQEYLISEVVKQAVDDFQERAKREGKEMIIEGEIEETLICDWEWTAEALGNLVKNALEHTEAGCVIRISWKQAPAVVRLMVEDNGCGIREEDIHHIFKQFYRSGNSKHRQGAGLGLSLAKAIVEGQGGNLSVQSSPGEGSLFCMTFLI